MKEYYRLCPLERSRSIHLGQGSVHVDLDAARARPPVTNDEQLLCAVDESTYFWVSGGGSILLEGRYLIVVERPVTRRINPGKLSLFTGRANDASEWEAPRLLLRELFEELIVVDAAGAVRLPSFDAPWLDARGICDAACRARQGDVTTAEDVVLQPHSLAGSRVTITSSGVTHEHELLLHIDRRRDINVLYALDSSSLTLDAFWALDGEADEEQPRQIFALDIASFVATNVTLGSDRGQRQVEPEHLTEHCLLLTETLRRG